MEQKELRTTYTSVSLDELTEQEQTLVNVAIEATHNSYSPYSHFAVGAAALLADGTIVPGCNQENAAFPVCMCAERTALFACGAQYPEQPIVAIAITARNADGLVAEPISPCGSCRQAIREVEERHHHDIRIILHSKSSTYVFRTIRDLLPLSFIQSSMES